MAHAYIPGLRVTDFITFERERRLPLRGRVLVEQGQRVTAGTVVARGSAYVVNVSLVTTRPASSRLTRVASTPNGPMSQRVVMPATISSACPSADRAT